MWWDTYLSHGTNLIQSSPSDSAGTTLDKSCPMGQVRIGIETLDANLRIVPGEKQSR
jgi:hypothetical protein